MFNISFFSKPTYRLHLQSFLAGDPPPFPNPPTSSSFPRNDSPNRLPKETSPKGARARDWARSTRTAPQEDHVRARLWGPAPSGRGGKARQLPPGGRGPRAPLCEPSLPPHAVHRPGPQPSSQRGAIDPPRPGPHLAALLALLLHGAASRQARPARAPRRPPQLHARRGLRPAGRAPPRAPHPALPGPEPRPRAQDTPRHALGTPRPGFPKAGLPRRPRPHFPVRSRPGSTPIGQPFCPAFERGSVFISSAPPQRSRCLMDPARLLLQRGWSIDSCRPYFRPNGARLLGSGFKGGGTGLATLQSSIWGGASMPRPYSPQPLLGGASLAPPITPPPASAADPSSFSNVFFLFGKGFRAAPGNTQRLLLVLHSRPTAGGDWGT